jgi:hypothetical protein
VANGSRGVVTALNPDARTLTIRLDGAEDQEITLPKSYLDGRGRGERNRRVDLAYATTGHRAQGLTRGRALVRLTGTEDVNWLYVQLSRARQDTRLYAVVGPEPQGGELDLPDRGQPDGYLQLAQALSRIGGQTPAIDTPSSPDIQRLSTAELRVERDGCVASRPCPRDRRHELARATAHRKQAEVALAAHRPPIGRQPAACFAGCSAATFESGAGGRPGGGSAAGGARQRRPGTLAEQVPDRGDQQERAGLDPLPPTGPARRGRPGRGLGRPRTAVTHAISLAVSHGQRNKPVVPERL